MQEITRDIVSAIIYSSDGKLLMGKKDPNKGGVYTDCWHIPGGGIDEGEDMEEALRREVFEEVGLSIKKAELVDSIGKGVSEKVLKDTGESVLCNMSFYVFKVQLEYSSENIELTPTDDLIELKWFNPRELKSIKLTPPSVELFKRLKLIN